ncbi:hypothetical protein GRI97_10745 [Altererythrobacter xixiisoli]|uniref:Uncharacterized protein n=2 Tax=Croceibacterium xixiisoli TaxID=1476466 RepID=A0A6I4TTX3_9SPHN|nr:hypothetical protein [Croceibacterium xixiisoli]MXO99466.1 hypothetical protein [Croceibacterium xixiisoli]
MTDNQTPPAPEPIVDRPQRRMLRRIFNGRTVPILLDDQPLLTYKQALRHLETLPAEARNAACLMMKHQADQA